MPAITFTEVVSFSSEDPNNPADNLLRPDRFRKWKCAVGSSEKQATVTLKMERLTSISSVDIGNDGAAFIEVLVGREGVSDYQVLLVASSFMSPGDSRNETNQNQVRMFGSDKLNKKVAEQKWDRVKVICTQPFNKKIQYGLSFITVRAPGQDVGSADASTSKITKLGSFTMKEEDEEADPISVGSVFARHKDKDPSTTLSGAAAIRAASSAAALKRKAEDNADTNFYQIKKKSPPEGREEEKPSSSERKERKPDTPKASKSSERERGETKERQRGETKERQRGETKERERTSTNGDPKKRERGETKERERTNGDPKKRDKNGGDERSKDKPRKERRDDNSDRRGDGKEERGRTSEAANRTSRPFASLMNDVVFVLSGYQNPERSQLRDAMTDMGAVYKSDWGTSCTHLICAFKNTPKYQQVRGKGRIVSAKWVTQCHKDKKKYPSRRYELESRRGGSGGSDSEDEVWAQELLPAAKQKPTKLENPPSPEPAADDEEGRYGDDVDTSDTEDTDDEIQRAMARKGTKDPGDAAKHAQPSKPPGEPSTSRERPSPPSHPKNSRKEQHEGDGGRRRSGEDSGKKNKDAGRRDEEGVGASNGTDDFTDDEVYKDDTDVDEECKQVLTAPDTASLPLPELGDYFQGKKFLVYGSLGEQQKNLLTRYITAFLGDVELYMTNKVQYVITEDAWDTNFDDALTDNPSVQFVKPGWVWKCCDKKKLLPHQPYLIVPKE